jgi:hypothetical protein
MAALNLQYNPCERKRDKKKKPCWGLKAGQ